MSTATSTEPVVSRDQASRRTIRHDALMSCNNVVVERRTPGSQLEENDALIGLHGSQEVWNGVRDNGTSRDANGCVAPALLLADAVEDD